MNTTTRHEIKCRTRRRTTRCLTQITKSQNEKLDMCENHLFNWKEWEKIQRGCFYVKNNLKPLLLD